MRHFLLCLTLCFTSMIFSVFNTTVLSAEETFTEGIWGQVFHTRGDQDRANAFRFSK